MWSRSAPPVPNQIGTLRCSNEGSLERTPPVPPRHRAKEGTAEAGKPEQGDGVWKTLVVCFQGKKQFNTRRMWSLYSGLWLKSLCFIGKGSDWFMVSSVSITGILFYSSCWN